MFFVPVLLTYVLFKSDNIFNYKPFQEGALERLYRWTQSHCRNVDNPDLTDLITHAMAKLQDRPVLFK